MKNSIKRVALVAAAAVTLGGLTGVAAHATAPSITVSTTAASTTASFATGTYNTVNLPDNTGDKVYTITTSGVGGVYYPTGTLTVGTLAAQSATSEIWYAGTYPGQANFTTSTLSFSTFSATAGTQTITVAGDHNTGVQTLTITWGAAAGTVLNHSTAYISNTQSADLLSADGTSLSASSTATGSAVALLTVAQYSSADTATAMTDAASNSVVVSIAGAGAVGTSASNRGPSVSVAAGSASTSIGAAQTGVQNFYVYADGRTGTATISVSVNGVAISSKTYTFVGAPSAAKAVANLKVLKAGGTVYTGTATATDATTVGGTSPVSVFLSDANGNKAYDSTEIVKAASSNTAVVSSVTCSYVTSGADAVVGEYNCPVAGVSGAASGSSATVTVTAYKADGVTVVATAAPVSFTIGGAIAKEVLSTDATSYLPLQAIKVVVTATDSAGNPAYDQDVTAVGSITSSILLGGTLASPSKIVGGTGTSTGQYAPAAEASSVVISGTDASSSANAISTTFDVANGAASTAAQAAIDAANEATDAANAAYDAANNAMDSADAATQAAQDAGTTAQSALDAVTQLSSDVQKLFSDLSAKVAALASAVAKIAKKVKA